MSGARNYTDKVYDVAALGEALIDFTEAGVASSGQRLFEQNPGGAVANMVSALARFKVRTAFIGKVGQDMHGRYLQETLAGVGVDTRGMVMAEDVFTTLAFVALRSGEREFSFARKPGADTCLRPEEVDHSILDNAALLHFGSLSLTNEPSRGATLAAVEYAAQQGLVVSYDPNYRATLWQTRQEAMREMRRPLPFVDVMKLSDEETELLCGIEDPEAAALALNRQGIKVVAVTLGKAGALVCVGGQCRAVPGYDIPASDTTGAGDAFWGGFLFQMLESGKALEDIGLEDAAAFARFGNATATLCVSRRGAIPAMPTLAEVEALRAKYG